MSSKTRRLQAVFWLLAVTVLLRSLVAPGFMLETSGETPWGFTITLCGGFDGAAGLEAPVGPPHGDHAHDGPAGADPDHELEHGLYSTHCAVWAAGGGFIASLHPPQISVATLPGKTPYAIERHARYARDSYYNRQQPRAPPATPTV